MKYQCITFWYQKTICSPLMVYTTKYGLVGSSVLRTDLCTKFAPELKIYQCIRFWYHELCGNQTYIKQHVPCSQEKSYILLYKFMPGSPRINLYLYSGNYGEDTISDHIVDCYLFSGRSCIRHWQAIWGMFCIQRNTVFSWMSYLFKIHV